MKIVFLETGKTKDKGIAELADTYYKRLKHYAKFELQTIPDLKNTKSMDEEEVKRKEGELILKHIDNSDFLVMLDENGKSFSSVAFANQLQQIMNRGMKKIVFVIGGAYGFDQRVYDRANLKVSLSKMTFSHQIIRPIFAEQLYRAFTILNNEPYHHQ